MTDAVLEEVLAWQSRPLEPVYAVVYFDALRMKIRDEAATKLTYRALRNITAKWKKPPRKWHAAKAQFAIHFGDRFVLTA